MRLKLVFLVLFANFYSSFACMGDLAAEIEHLLDYGDYDGEFRDPDEPDLYAYEEFEEGPSDVHRDRIEALRRKVEQNEKYLERVKEGRGPNSPEYRRLAEKNCKAINCNFEAETMCGWISIGKLATAKRDKPLKKTDPITTTTPDPNAGFDPNNPDAWANPDLTFGTEEGINSEVIRKSPSRNPSDAMVNFFEGLNENIKDKNLMPKGSGLGKDDEGLLGSVLGGSDTNLFSSFLGGGDSGGVLDELGTMLTGLTGKFMAWYPFRGHLGNPVAEDTWYAGAYLFEGETASMTSAVEFIVDMDIDISFWTAGGASLKFCCGSDLLEATENCPFAQSGKSKKWLHKKVNCPKGTQLLSLICSNNDSGGKDGACAVDDIKMRDTECRQVYIPREASPNFFSIKMAESGGIGGIAGGGPLGGILGKAK